MVEILIPLAAVVILTACGLTFFMIFKDSKSYVKMSTSESVAVSPPKIPVAKAVPSARSEQIAKPQPTVKPKTPNNLPFNINPYYVLQQTQMKMLEDLLRQNSKAVITQSAPDNVGVGKTQLALEYAHKHKDDYRGGILWVTVSQDVVSEYGLLALPLDLVTPGKMKKSDRGLCVKQWFDRCDGKTLLILDNLNNLEDYVSLQPFLPSISKCHVIFTSRNSNLDRSAMHLDVLPEDQALKLLLRVSARSEEDISNAQAICKTLGNLPLAIELAGKRIKYSKKLTSFTDFFQELSTQPQTTNPSHIACIQKSLSTYSDFLNIPPLRKIITAIISFAPTSINASILSALCGLSPNKFNDYITLLADHSLIRLQTDGRIIIHDKMRQLLADHISLDEVKALRSEYIVQLEEWFKKHNDIATLSLSLPETPHLVKAAELAVKANIMPQAFELCLYLSRHFNLIGDYGQNLKWADKCKSVLRVRSNEDSAKLGLAYNEIGLAWKAMGKHQQAISSLNQGLTVLDRTFKSYHPHIAMISNSLGVTYAAMGNYSQAVKYFEEALAINKRSYGELHASVARDLSHLGKATFQLGEIKKARQHLQKSYHLHLKFYGEDHPFTIQTKKTLDTLP